MEPVKFTCQCQNASSRWSQEPPNSMHSYRVECDSCGKFIKWGAASECQDRLNARDPITVISYEPKDHQPKSTIDDFLA
jgi:hypothetical protein